MNWSLFWAAAGVVAAFLAVGVTLWIGIRERQRSSQARYDDARPVLQIISKPEGIPTERGDLSALNWKELPHITVLNVGKGPASNIRSVIYGPAAIAVRDAASGGYIHFNKDKENHWYDWTTDVVSQADKKELQYVYAETFGPNQFSETNKHIQPKDHKQKPIPFNAPEQPLSQPSLKEPRHICRVTITYHDIFHRKHASIYDLVFRQGWQVVAFIDDIISDLSDLVA
jgi:hypothetical protein